MHIRYNSDSVCVALQWCIMSMYYSQASISYCEDCIPKNQSWLIYIEFSSVWILNTNEFIHVSFQVRTSWRMKQYWHMGLCSLRLSDTYMHQYSILTIIGSDNGLSPGGRQAIIWTHGGILLIGSLATNFIEISIPIHTLSFKKIHLKMSSGKWRPFFLSFNVLTYPGLVVP